MPTFTGRILFFHGYTQSSSIFYAKTSALRKKLIKMGYKCVYLNGPDKLTPADFPSNDALSKFNSVPVNDDSETNLRAWWLKPNNTNESITVDQSIDAIRDYIEENKVIEDEDIKQSLEEEDKSLPIVGLIGFSQGSGLVGLLMNKFDDIFKTNLKFVILYSGFMLDTGKGSGNESLHHYYTQNTHNIKALHVLGEMDTAVSEERSMKLYNFSKEYSTLLKHPGGHFVPNSKIYVEQVAGWISTVMNPPEKDTEESKETKEKDDLDDILNMMDSIGKA